MILVLWLRIMLGQTTSPAKTSSFSLWLNYLPNNQDSNKRVLCKDSIALSPAATLVWLGFSEQGMPLTYDSLGILRGFLQSSSCWIPLLDTRIKRQGKQEYYWPVGVYEDSFMCIICKGRDEYPPFPKPMIMEVPLCMPFLGMDPGLSGGNEEKHWRGLVGIENMSRELDDGKGLSTREIGDLKAGIVKKRAGLDRDALHLHLVFYPFVYIGGL
jgi:hypothetical protein